ncbi:hypothetical protein VP01_1207g6 [Puccinia sorghi]|uniref:Clr5 domain-containing protein n=1 Tax=Puccinia sorghi TaxID=27349 RepID=A0A0L6VQE6_9BASI|nr:hypothetical protein VP01_1207g6 [Puccinia sorghi]
MNSSHPPTTPPLSTRQVTLQKLENQFQEEVAQMLEETHSLTVSQWNLTCRKEDWGPIKLGSQKVENLEETITTYFNRGLTIQQIHHALTTRHNYTQSLRSLKRKLNTMNLSRHTDDLDSQKVDDVMLVTGR